jgi:hypothetical protein
LQRELYQPNVIVAMTTSELRFKSYNTRRNLPKATGRRRGEANFLGMFLRAIQKELSEPWLYGRNFPIPDCGVADLLLCQLPSGGNINGGTDQVHLTAFEMKLSDWRKALQQAYRYKYYADLSVVVLPAKSAARALQSQCLFETLGIELWTLDVATSDISRHVVHSNPTGPLNSAKRSLALSKLPSRIADFRMSHKES